MSNLKNPRSPALQADSSPSEPPGKPQLKKYISLTPSESWTYL